MVKNQSQNILEKCAEIIRHLQKSELKPDKYDSSFLSEPLDLRKIAATPSEAKFLAHVVSMVLQESPYDQSADAGIATDKEQTWKSLDYMLQCRMKSDKIDGFKHDHSLEQPFSSSRPFTPDYKPENLRQALEFVRWRESNKWIRGDKACYLVEPVSHGLARQGMFTAGESNYVNSAMFAYYSLSRERQDEQETLEHESQRIKAEEKVPQIWRALDSAGFPNLRVDLQDAEAILVNYLGLDSKILEMDVGQKVKSQRGWQHR